MEKSGMGALGLAAMGSMSFSDKILKDAIIGHGTHRYKVDLNWGKLNSKNFPVKDCHEMVQDAKGRIILLTNHTKNNVLIYDKSGKLLDSWGKEYPGAHGLTLHDENGTEFLYISDNERHEVIKTTLDGKIIQVFSLSQGKREISEKRGVYPNGNCNC